MTQSKTNTKDRIQLEEGWKQYVGDWLLRPEMQHLAAFLRDRKNHGARIYPPSRQLFSAFDATPFDQVKVVILGQDPYHGAGQAHGLSFSVPPGIEIPPSLSNIYKELQQDLGMSKPYHGCLLSWAQQGVLLMNAVLTVEHGRPGSHQKRGWEHFTDHVIDMLNQHREGIVFLLWGSYAQAKGARIDTKKHCVFHAPHPSPLSAHRGFFGCKHFSLANQYLIEHNQTPIRWQSVCEPPQISTRVRPQNTAVP